MNYVIKSPSMGIELFQALHITNSSTVIILGTDFYLHTGKHNPTSEYLKILIAITIKNVLTTYFY